MRNAPRLTLDSSLENDARSQRAIGDVPVMRVVLLMIVLTVPVAAVGARLVRLQAQLTDDFITAWEVTTVTEETIPCRDGRILSADGQVLAHDRLRYDVAVHYRWLEDPPDERWLTQQALTRLNRRARRQAALVEEAKQSVLADRLRMWELLATTLDVPQSQLDDARRETQRRVESIVKSVTRRRDERLAESLPETKVNQSLFTENFAPQSGAWWRKVQNVVIGQLTTAPRRERLEPVIVREELEHHVVAIDVGIEPVTAIEITPSLFPGVLVRTSSERVYSQGSVASHIIGVRTELRPEELSLRSTAYAGDRRGRNGIERSFDPRLKGRRGTRRIVRNRGGEVISQETLQNPVPGEDVTLTIDFSLQRTAERLLDEALALPSSAARDSTVPPKVDGPQGGCLVVLDVRTGDVITAAASPRHDLQLLTRPDPEEWHAAIADPRRPFFPRVTQMTVPPGSVFKILTAVALLESGRIDPDEPIFCQGYLDRPDRNRCYVFRHYGVGHGEMDLSDAVCQSCNVYFFTAARTLGPAVISDWASRFGLGVTTGAEVPNEKGGHLPRVGADGKIIDEQWYAGSTLQMAIGQASLAVTPLQVARMVAAVANDGYLVTPRFVSPRDETVPSTFPASDVQLVAYETDMSLPRVERIPGLSPCTLQRVRDAMTLVVQSPKGTGRRAALEGVTIAGKTGTAEVGGGKNDHAWFVGFVPAEAPRYAFAVVLEHGGSGGSTAAPLAKEFIEAMTDSGLLRRNASSKSAAN